jgi:hypothetical protein
MTDPSLRLNWIRLEARVKTVEMIDSLLSKPIVMEFVIKTGWFCEEKGAFFVWEKVLCFVM